MRPIINVDNAKKSILYRVTHKKKARAFDARYPRTVRVFVAVSAVQKDHKKDKRRFDVLDMVGEKAVKEVLTPAIFAKPKH
jgi:hypothetical protein